MSFDKFENATTSCSWDMIGIDYFVDWFLDKRQKKTIDNRSRKNTENKPNEKR